MKIFALDSAGKTAGVALWQDGALLYESYLAAGFTHSETLLPLCRAALSLTHTACADIDLFAACAGPGSFTGLRIGLATLKGLALPLGTPCAGVSTLEALAWATAQEGLVATALDARRGEVYCALFERRAGQVLRLCEDDAMPAVAFAEKAAALAGGRPVLCAGDGAALLVRAAEAPLAGTAPAASFSLSPEPYRLGRANGVCLAAKALFDAGKTADAAALAPEYHRLSQAERERMNK